MSKFADKYIASLYGLHRQEYAKAYWLHLNGCGLEPSSKAIFFAETIKDKLAAIKRHESYYARCPEDCLEQDIERWERVSEGRRNRSFGSSAAEADQGPAGAVKSFSLGA
jgi:hypothetical protein